MPGRRGIAVGLVALALVTVGCGDDSGADACGLVTGAEAQRILGTRVRAPEPDDESLDSGSSCAWISADSTRDPEAAVYGFFVAAGDDAAGRREFARRRASTDPEFPIAPVDGLGDAAYFVEPTELNSLSGVPSLPTLHVRTGDTVLVVGTFDSDEHPVDAAGARRMQQAVARAALTRV